MRIPTHRVADPLRGLWAIRGRRHIEAGPHIDREHQSTSSQRRSVGLQRGVRVARAPAQH